ncbi:hypothetical protein CBR_g39021 [Chara braunii]|uniref:Reverse transcriptase domain-containing protein n=1 Tax=Chara braunii TaxID=69332 RepID=A0A388LQW1_CHABU|nr:hypothetical protein CBR_g39021 [Chara braunii]|eukprot:GBG84645.1 hypothetical protein CBR_g39021 [Chara braunii]
MIELRHPFEDAAPTACTAVGMLKYANLYYEDILRTRRLNEEVDTDLSQQSDMWEDTSVQLSTAAKLDMDRPVTLEELTQTVKTMARGKSPEVDGLTVEFYSANWGVFGPLLVELYNEVLVGGRLGKGMTHGVITLLFKKGDKSVVKNWRPMSLLNVSYKILAKSLARRLSKHLPKLVENDQGAFVQRRSIFNNYVTAIETLEIVQSEGLDTAVLLLDLEKAYDKMEVLLNRVRRNSDITAQWRGVQGKSIGGRPVCKSPEEPAGSRSSPQQSFAAASDRPAQKGQSGADRDCDHSSDPFFNSLPMSAQAQSSVGQTGESEAMGEDALDPFGFMLGGKGKQAETRDPDPASQRPTDAGPRKTESSAPVPTSIDDLFGFVWSVEGQEQPTHITAQQHSAPSASADPFMGVDWIFDAPSPVNHPDVKEGAPSAQQQHSDPFLNMFSSGFSSGGPLPPNTTTTARGEEYGTTGMSSSDPATNRAGGNMAGTSSAANPVEEEEDPDGVMQPPSGLSLPAAKRRGEKFFRHGNFAEALKYFTWVLMLADVRGPMGVEFFGTADILLKRAACYNGIGSYRKAVQDCTKLVSNSGLDLHNS